MVFFVFYAQAEVRINEVMSSNGATLADEDGDYEDWIELYNSGDIPVDLGGWGLSDRTDEPFRWVLPSVILAPGGHLTIWASGKDRKPDQEIFTATPDELEGLVAWYRSEDLAELSQDEAVAEWPDVSGNQNHATQEIVSARPTFQTEVLNGFPALRFDGSNDQFSLPRATFAGMDSLENFTMLILARWDGKTTSGLWGTGPSGSNSGNLHFEITNGGGLRLRVAGMNSIQVNGAVETGWNLFGASQRTRDDEANSRVFLNGGVIGTRQEDTGVSTLANYGGFFLGNSHDSNRNFQGMMAEVVLFNRTLESEERRGVERYLMEKYAFTPEGGGPLIDPMHTNFSISSAGEPLFLTRPDGVRADEVPPVEIPRDTSFGRSPDGGENWVYYLEPTPGAPNTTAAYAAPIDPPGFSHARGFYEEGFSLELTHPDSEATLYYTLNGSPPDEVNGIPYSGPIPVTTTSVVRAMAVKEGTLPVPRVMTHSYLFLEDVIQQSDDPEELGFPDHWGGWEAVHYGMNPEITQHPDYAPRMMEAMTSIPSLSLVMDMDDMFDPDTGVYTNRTRKGYAWERPVSVELIHPEGAKPGLQVNAGIRAQGGASRQVNNTPKGSLRLLFKSEYEARRLEFPFFLSSGSAMDDFNTITLRAEYNNEWLHWSSEQRNRGQYIRDRFIRDSQIAMTGFGSHSNHVHLYINGVYWGLYNPSERIDAAFGANYFGGEREDWDAITHRGVRDGNQQAWNAMEAIAAGGLESLAAYEAIQAYLDIPQYTDYMLLNLWAGMHDWPHNNWNSIRRREAGAGFMFFCWDSERSMEGLNDNRISAGQDAAKFFAALRENPEYRLLFADHVHRHLFNDGVLTPDRAVARYQQTAAEVEAAVIAESARWGSYRRDKSCRGAPCVLYTRNDHWQAEYERLVNNYLPHRTGVAVGQFRAAGLYPQTDAPVFTPHGGALLSAQAVSVNASEGVIYYTTNGEDPRVYGTGAVSGDAEIYAAPLLLENNAVLRARVLKDGEWSALNEAEYKVPPVTPHPLAEGPYHFSEWDAEAAAGTYPAHMIFEQVKEGDPGLTTGMDGYWTLPYNLTSRSRVVGLGEEGVGFINTGNAQDVEGAGYLGSALLGLDTTGETNLRVQWTGGTVLPNERTYGLRLQARIGAAGDFEDVLNAQGQPVEYLRHATENHSEVIGPVTLPTSLENQPYVELRWKYYYVLGDSGPRAMLRLGNVIVTSGENPPADHLNVEGLPTALNGEADLPPISVRVLDAAGVLVETWTGTITLSLIGNGTLSGETSVEAENGVAVFEGLNLEGVGALQLVATAEGLTEGQAATRSLHLVDLWVPPMLQGEQDADGDNLNRIPVAFRFRIEGLAEGATYRYGNRMIHDPTDTQAGDDGAGNFILIPADGSDWVRSTSRPRFEEGDLNSRHAELTADANGRWEGWVVTEPTGNARFTPGNILRPLLILNDGEGGEDPVWFLRSDNTVMALELGPEAGQGTAVYGEAHHSDARFVAIYDNADTLLALTHVEAMGSEFDDRYADFYLDTVAAHPGRWGTLIPNDLQNAEVRVAFFNADGTDLEIGFEETVPHGGGPEAVWLPASTEFVFLPGGDGRWDDPNHWTAPGWPAGAGVAATVPAPLWDNRAVTIPEGLSVSIGSLSFTNGNYRNRIDGAGNFLFDGDDGPAQVVTTDGGDGFAEFDLDGLVTLVTSLRLDTQSVEENPLEPEYGALRLRGNWAGSGGLTKTGPGVASLTGSGKNFTGDLIVEEGVLRITAPATPGQVASVSVQSGGQLRLVSSGENRIYAFGTPVQFAGSGREPEDVETGDQRGILGALRFDPADNDNVATLPSGVLLVGEPPVSLHVDGTRNLLDIGGSFEGPATFSKSGGGSLRLSGANTAALTASVENGALRVDGAYPELVVSLGNDGVLTGTGVVASASGSGTLELGPGEMLTAQTVSGLSYRFRHEVGGPPPVLRLQGGTPFATPFNPANSFVLYLNEPPPTHPRFGFFSDISEDLANWTSPGSWSVYLQDDEGSEEYQGTSYSLLTDSPSLFTARHSLNGVEGTLLGASVGPANFQDWAEANALPSGMDGPSDNPFGSSPNLINYALGLPAGIFPGEPDIQLGLDQDGRLFARFRRDPTLTDLVYIVEVTSDLTDWSEAGILYDSNADPSPNNDFERMWIQEDSQNHPRRFLRLRVRLDSE